MKAEERCVVCSTGTACSSAAATRSAGTGNPFVTTRQAMSCEKKACRTSRARSFGSVAR